MGVIRNFNSIRNNNNNDNPEDWIYISSDGEENLDHNNETSQVTSRSIRRNKRSKNKLPPNTKPEPTFAGLGVKGKSHKKFRRYANANLLNDTLFSSLVTESDLDDVSINDFIPSTPSSFTLLMNEMMDRSVAFDLNEFINCTEDQQIRMIKRVEKVIELEMSKIQKEDPNAEQDINRCFHRIAPAIRKQLLKRHVPLGILASIEQKVIDHFRNHPQSTYKTILDCSYHRFLLHACCQYLNLYCRSCTTKGKKRLSCVHNEHHHFEEPSQLLSEYLESSNH